MKFFPPEAALASVLFSRGYRSLHTCSPMSIIEAANYAIKHGIAEEPRSGFHTGMQYGIRLYALKGPYDAEVHLRGDDIPGEKLEYYSKDAPGIIIDNSAYDLLTPKERKKLRLQIDLVKGLMRRLRRSNKLLITEEPIYESKLIYLDPSADEELKEVEPGAYYIIGGVIDKGNRLSGITSKLASRRDAERKRITLFGRLEGVTNTLVGISKILIYMFRGVPKDAAVLLTAPRRVIKRLIRSEKDEERRRMLERLLKIKKGRTEYAEEPLEALSEILLGFFD